MKVSEESKPTVSFKSIDITVSNSDFLNAFLSFLGNLLKGLLNEVLSDLLKDLLISQVNNHLQYAKPLEYMETNPQLSVDTRYTRIRKSPVSLIMEFSGYVLKSNDIDNRYVPSKIQQTPSKMVMVQDIIYSFGIEMIQSLFYEFNRAKAYDLTFTKTGKYSSPSGDSDYVFMDLYKNNLFLLQDDLVLLKLFPEIKDIYANLSEQDISYSINMNNIQSDKIGPGGLLIKMSYNLTININNVPIVTFKINDGQFVGKMNVRYTAHKDQNQVYLRGFFYFKFVNYQYPTDITVINNPNNFSMNSTDFNSNIQTLLFMFQEMMHSVITANSYDSQCIQREIVLFAENRKEIGFYYWPNRIEYWQKI